MNRNLTIHALGVTQIINWGVLFYSLSLLATPSMAQTGLSQLYVYAGFSWALLLGGMIAASIGRILDVQGGRFVMCIGTLLGALGLFLWAEAKGIYSYFLAWTVIGVAMRMSLYEAAFASLVALHGQKARRAISIVTLYGALASTIFWPIAHYLHLYYGFQVTLYVFAACLAFISFPLHYFFLPKQSVKVEALEAHDEIGLVHESQKRVAMVVFALALSLSSFVFAALAIHFITFLESWGLALVIAVQISSTKGVAQFFGRLVDMLYASHYHPLTMAIFASFMLPLAFLCLAFEVSWVAALIFALLYGVGQGLLTIVRGAVPLALFGRKGYGEVIGKIATPSLLVTALTPALFAVFLEKYGFHAGLALLSLLSVLSALAMLALKLYLKK